MAQEVQWLPNSLTLRTSSTKPFSAFIVRNASRTTSSDLGSFIEWSRDGQNTVSVKTVADGGSRDRDSRDITDITSGDGCLRDYTLVNTCSFNFIIIQKSKLFSYIVSSWKLSLVLVPLAWKPVMPTESGLTT